MKAIPIKTLPIVERWDCHSCSKCCHGTIIPLDETDRQRLQEQRWDEHPDFRATPVVIRQGRLQSDYRLAHRPDGSCVFLTADGLCRVHAEFGFEQKPRVCRTFPLQVVPLGRFAYLTTRRSCPSAATDQGRPVGDHLAGFRRLLQAGEKHPQAGPPPRLTRRQPASWELFLQVADAIERMMIDKRFPVVRRLVHSLKFCDLIEQCKFRQVDESRWDELMEILEDSSLQEAGEWFRDRQPPGRSAATLFRQAASHYVRLHPQYRAEPSWSTRWQFAAAAWKIVRGQGTVPSLHPDFPPTTFEALDRPVGPLADEVRQPLDRYFENSAVSKQYAILDRTDWPLVDSFRAFAFGFPVAMWVLRLATGERMAERNDLLDVLTAIDRAQGYGPLSGRRHRRSLTTLKALGELPRLIAWYAR